MSFKEDSLYLTANSLQQNLFAVLASVFLARFLSPNQFGVFSFFLSILTIYTLVSTGGLRQYLPAISKRRMLAGQPPPSSMLSWALIIVGLVTAIHLALQATGIYARIGVRTEGISLLLALFIITRAFILSVRGILIGFGRMKLFFFTSVAQELTKFTALPLLFLAGILDVRSVIFSWTMLSVGFALLMAAVYFNWLRDFPVRQSWKPVRSPELTEALTFLFPAASLMLIPRLIIFSVGLRAGAELTALMTVALTFTSVFGIFLNPYQTAFLSHLQSHRTTEDLRKYMASAGARLLILAVFLAGATFGIGWFGTVPVFGGEYIQARAYLLPLSVVFALESPKTVLDAFWVSRLPGKALIWLEIVKLASIPVLILVSPDTGLTVKIYLLGVLFALVNLIKLMAIKRRLYDSET